MCLYTIQKTAGAVFSRYCAVYSGANLYQSYDWEELLQQSVPSGDGYFLLRDNVPIGGFSMGERELSTPFLIPPFQNKKAFWEAVLTCVPSQQPLQELFFDKIPESHLEALTALGASVCWAQRRMNRPTGPVEAPLPDGFYFAKPTPDDQEEIVRVVHKAHTNGYTSTVYGPPAIETVAETVQKRFALFSETNSLSMGTLVKTLNDSEIAAVCLAGIYPDSPHQFSTIHQVSVSPAFRRRGLAQAAMARTISKAYESSPVISLGVLIGNPAEKLYTKLGFFPGPAYYRLKLSLHH